MQDNPCKSNFIKYELKSIYKVVLIIGFFKGVICLKINDIGRLQGINKYQKMNQKDQELKQKDNKKDQISISNEAKVLLEQTKETTSKDKIIQIKEQIENGTYQVDSKKVAEKMIEWFNK